MYGFICWKTTSLHPHDLLGWLANSYCSTLVLSFLCHIWTYYCKAFLWYCWLFVSIVLLQFDSQSPSLCSNDSFSFLIFFLNYFDFFIHCFYRMHWFSLFVCFLFFVLFLGFFLLCIFFVVLFFVSSFPPALLCHSFFYFQVHFVSFLLHLLIFVCICFHFVSISFDFGY